MGPTLWNVTFNAVLQGIEFTVYADDVLMIVEGRNEKAYNGKLPNTQLSSLLPYYVYG